MISAPHTFFRRDCRIALNGYLPVLVSDMSKIAASRTDDVCFVSIGALYSANGPVKSSSLSLLISTCVSN